MEDIDRIVIETESRSKSNQHRIDDLEKKTDSIHELALSVRDLASQMARMIEEQKRQGERLTVLERVPGERWNNMTRTIVTATITTIVGGVVGSLLTILMK